jgi:hypothetical protein
MLQISSNVQYLFSAYFYRPSMPMAMGAVQVENYTSTFQMQVVKSTISNYWMRLSMISRIIQTEVNVICRSEAEADNIDRGLNNS